MIPLDQLLPFVLASALLSLAPGPDNLFVLSQSALYGKRSGLWITLGLCSGLVVHTSAVALGVAALLASSPVAFNLLRIGGALYLLYLAWQAFTAPPGKMGVQGSNLQKAGPLYRRGVLMNISNPKVSIFFLAFLPQFVSPQAGPAGMQIVGLGAIFILVALTIFGAIAFLAGVLSTHLRRSPGLQQRIHQLSGTVFLLLAARLLLPD